MMGKKLKTKSNQPKRSSDLDAVSRACPSPERVVFRFRNNRRTCPGHQEPARVNDVPLGSGAGGWALKTSSEKIFDSQQEQEGWGKAILKEKGQQRRRQSLPSIPCATRSLTLACGSGCTDSTCTESWQRFLPPRAEGPVRLGTASSAWGEAEPRQTRRLQPLLMVPHQEGEL